MVYVDDMYRYPLGQFHRMKMSHMIADTPEELHLMADKIGLSRRWFQKDHYDVCLSMRAKAVSFGASEIDIRELALKCRHVPLGMLHSGATKTTGISKPAFPITRFGRS